MTENATERIGTLLFAPDTLNIITLGAIARRVSQSFFSKLTPTAFHRQTQNKVKFFLVKETEKIRVLQ